MSQKWEMITSEAAQSWCFHVRLEWFYKAVFTRAPKIRCIYDIIKS